MSYSIGPTDRWQVAGKLLKIFWSIAGGERKAGGKKHMLQQEFFTSRFVKNDHCFIRLFQRQKIRFHNIVSCFLQKLQCYLSG